MVENSGTIVANGGEIYLTTNAVNELLKGVVNNTGVIEANSLDDVTGKVEVYAHGGTANVSGEIKAEGGFVETSGKDLKVADGTIIKAKKWLIDPVSVMIDSTLAGTIQTALGSGDVTITTAGDGSNTPSTANNEFVGDIFSNGTIYVVSDITWNTAQKLTLSADKDIYIHSNITASSGGQLALYYNQANSTFDPIGNPWMNGNLYLQGGKINLQNGDNFFTKNSSADSGKTWTVISTKTELQNMATNDNTKNYALGADILNIGSFTPLGNDTTPFKGSFDGLGHKITGLTITNSHTDNTADGYYSTYYLGLFGYVNNAASIIRNIGLENINIQNNAIYAHIGALVGYLNAGTIENVYTTGTLSSIATGYSDGDIGGLVGYAKGTINRSYSTAKVYSTHLPYAGGLVGKSDTGFSMNDVYYVPVEQTQSVVGFDSAGGLIGMVYNQSSINRAYVLGGEVISAGYGEAGGAIGKMIGTYTGNYNFQSVYSTAKARITSIARGGSIVEADLLEGPMYNAHGLIGYYSQGSASMNGYTYDMDISGNTSAFVSPFGYAASGNTTAQMTGTSLRNTLGNGFLYFDGYYPVLKSMMAPAAYVKVNSASGGTDFTGGNGYTFIPVQNGATESGALTYTYYYPWFGIQITDLSGYAGEVLSISGTGLSLSGTAPTQQQLQQSGLKYLDGKLLIKNPVTYAFSIQSIGDKNLGDAVTLPTVTYKNASNNSVTPSGTTTIIVYDSQNNDVTSRATAGTLGAGTYTVKAVLDDNTYMATSSTPLSFSVSQQRVGYSLSSGSTASLTYGSSFAIPTATYSGTVNGINVTGSTSVKVYNSSGNDVTAQATAGTLPAGTYKVKAVLTDDNYYASTSNSYATILTVNKKNLTYTTTGGTNTYGQAFTLPTPTFTGGIPTGTTSVKVYDNNSNDVTSQATAGTLKPGNYIVKTTLTDNNYKLADIGNTFGTLTINAKEVTGTLDSLVRTYGAAISLPTVTLSDTNANASTSVKIYDSQNVDVTSQALAGTLIAGTYIVKAENSNTNYSLGTTTGTLTINAKEVTGTLDSLVRTYGTAISLPTVTLSDTNVNASTSVKIYNSQNVDVTSQALAGTLIAGTYIVKAENSNTNYSLGTTTGTLTINAKPTTTEISFPKINQTFGQPIILDGILSDEQIALGTKIVVLDATNKDVTELALQGKIQPGKYSVKAINNNANYSLTSNSVELTINSALDPVTLVKTQVSEPIIPVIPTITAPKINVDVKPATQIKQDVALKLGISDTTNVSLVSQTIEGQSNKVISMSDLKPLTTTTSIESSNVSEVRVPLSQNSIVDLVNGGVTLPTGVDQQFFVVTTGSNNTNSSTTTNSETNDNKKTKGTN